MPQIPHELLPWLNTVTSLTKRLALITGDAQVNLLDQRLVKASWWDHFVLHISENVFKREVMIASNNIPCWYARTLIPTSTYLANQEFFSQLQSQTTLGQIIYNNKLIKRRLKPIYTIDHNFIEYYWFNQLLPDTSTYYWVRPSEFTYEKKFSFFLYEIFFSSLLEVSSILK